MREIQHVGVEFGMSAMLHDTHGKPKPTQLEPK